MVVIQCPHCNGDIELEDDTFGLFACPHCDKEFEFESSFDNESSNLTNKMFLGLLLISIMILSSGALLINEALTYEYVGPTTECEYENDEWTNFFLPSDCEEIYPEGYEPYDSKFLELCCGIIFLLIGLGIAITTFITRLRGRVRFENGE